MVVVGKGGVGKTTTAAALALRFADDGIATHLLSIDPAHSLGDVLGRTIERGAVVPCDCATGLTAEEFDGPGEADRWFGRTREALAELVERGTYLDQDDVMEFLGRSLPGMDEVMAALRIATLSAAESPDRVVVDTAPTGHTLRMLRSGDTVRGWTHALDAMAEKASAVGLALSGRRVRLAGEVVLDELQTEIDHFERCVRREADLVVVTREGTVIESETNRFLRRLRRDGYPVRAVVDVGGASRPVGPSDVPWFEVPLASDPVGCERLRSWGRPFTASDTSHRAIHDDDAACSDLLSDLLARAIVFFAGKGGVGKSTCATAFALEASRHKRVLLLGLDPAGSLGDLLGMEVGPTGTRFGDNLDVRQVDADMALGRFRDRHADRIREAFERLGFDSSVALDRHVLEAIVELAPPGVDEVFSLNEIIESSADHDLLVLDTAPTGHFLRLLDMAGSALDWTRSMLRIMLRYRSVLRLEDLARETLDLARKLRAFNEALQDPARAAVVAVTCTGTLAERETGRLVSTLRDREIPVPAVIANRRHAPEGPLVADNGGTRRILAPEMVPRPVGSERLRDFLRAWRCP